jgi:hypothetical protein
MSEENLEIARRVFYAFQSGLKRGEPGASYDTGLLAPGRRVVMPPSGPGFRDCARDSFAMDPSVAAGRMSEKRPSDASASRARARFCQGFARLHVKAGNVGFRTEGVKRREERARIGLG